MRSDAHRLFPKKIDGLLLMSSRYYCAKTTERPSAKTVDKVTPKLLSKKTPTGNYELY